MGGALRTAYAGPARTPRASQRDDPRPPDGRERSPSRRHTRPLESFLVVWGESRLWLAGPTSDIVHELRVHRLCQTARVGLAQDLLPRVRHVFHRVMFPEVV